jgi:hypothetical protein
MKCSQVAAVVAFVVLSLTACSSGNSADTQPRATPVPAEAAVEATTQAEATPTPEPTTEEPTQDGKYGPSQSNERGNLVKTLGQLAGVGSETDPDVITAEFTVTAIEPNFTCTSEYAEPSMYGNYIAITLDVQTTAALADQSWPVFNVSEYDFKVISPEGTRENDSSGNAYMCLNEAERLPSEIGPGEHVTGKIVLDSAHTSGSIVFAPAAVQGGWEWGF